jgi:hypothetical protein
MSVKFHPAWSSEGRQMMLSGVGVEELFLRDIANGIRSQVIERSFSAGAEIR